MARANAGSKCFLLLCLSTVVIFSSNVYGVSDSLDLLRDLRDQSPDRVVYLTDDIVREIFKKGDTEREFSIITVFFVADLNAQNPSLRLDHLVAEFKFAAKTFYRTHHTTENEDALFFCIADIKNTNMAFQLFDVQTLPHVSFAKPNGKKSSIKWEQYGRTAEGIAQFVTKETGLPVGDIERPPKYSKLQLAIAGGFLLLLSPFALRFVLTNKTPIHSPWTWCIGGLFIYFFSVSGGMYNIIRGMPPFSRDPKNPAKLIYFYSSSGAQFWVEGFTIGGLYMLFGLLLTMITFVAPLIPNRQIQRLVILTAIGLCFLSVKQLVALDNWKTGYSIHGFYPNSWR